MKQLFVVFLALITSQVLRGQNVDLWGGGVVNPSGDIAVPILLYEPLTGHMLLDTYGLNRVVDTQPFAGGSFYVEVAGDDVSMLSLIIEGPQPLQQLDLLGYQYGVAWESTYFFERQQLFGIPVESEFLVPGLSLLYRYPAGLDVLQDFGTVEMGTNFGPMLPGAIMFGGVEAIQLDLNMDESFGCPDVDSLTAAISSGNSQDFHDINRDGVVDQNDLSMWLAVAGTLEVGGPFLPGDGNLDGVVDTSDFNIWNAQRGTFGTSWCTGDFNVNGNTDVSDFNVWNENKFTASAAMTSVPEPSVPESTLVLWLVAGAIWLRRVRL